MKAVAKRSEDGLVRPLKVLVPLIQDELKAGDAAGVEHYRRAGEMLLEAKEQVESGGWMGWLDRNFHLSRSSAQRYMMLAGKVTRGAGKTRTLSEAVTPHRSDGRAGWTAPVREIAASVNLDRLAEERENRQKETKLLHDLAQKLIDIGYRVLAAKLHPDKGGSTEAMQRLNEVRRRLKEAI